MDTLHTALLGHVVYFYLITNYMHPEAMARPTWYVSELVNRWERNLTSLNRSIAVSGWTSR